MVFDALLDARSSAADRRQVEAIDGLLAPIAHRGLLTPDEGLELIRDLEEIEHGHQRTIWPHVRSF